MVSWLASRWLLISSLANSLSRSRSSPFRLFKFADQSAAMAAKLTRSWEALARQARDLIPAKTAKATAAAGVLVMVSLVALSLWDWSVRLSVSLAHWLANQVAYRLPLAVNLNLTF